MANVNITFEELGTQPFLFIDTKALRSELIGFGADFQSVAGPNDGPAILNQLGNFGFNARSGEHFLAYNVGAGYLNGGTAISGVRIVFSQSWSEVGVWSNSIFGGQTTMVAFDSNNQAVGSATVTDNGQWQQLLIRNPDIRSVVMRSSNQFGAYDDLTAVPEPATVLALGAGLAALVARRRKA
jgi:hypothetical protein